MGARDVEPVGALLAEHDFVRRHDDATEHHVDCHCYAPSRRQGITRLHAYDAVSSDKGSVGTQFASDR